MEAVDGTRTELVNGSVVEVVSVDNDVGGPTATFDFSRTGCVHDNSCDEELDGAACSTGTGCENLMDEISI